MSKEIIIQNNQKGNGLIGLPPFKGKKVPSLYAGNNSVPVEVWEYIRTLGVIKVYIKKGILRELNLGEVKEISPEKLAKLFSFEEFQDAIDEGADGIKSETGGFFLVTLSEKTEEKKLPNKVKSFRVKASAEDARAVAYTQYVTKMGGKLNPKVKVKDLTDMELEDAEDIIKNTFNPTTLKGWLKLKSDTLRLMVQEQRKRIKEHKGKGELEDMNTED